MSDETAAGHLLALLKEAREYTIGILIEPDLDEDGQEAGWTISYVIHGWPAVQGQNVDFPGDRLASAYDLETAVAAAMKPLRELGRAYNAYIDRGLKRDS